MCRQGDSLDTFGRLAQFQDEDDQRHHHHHHHHHQHNHNHNQESPRWRRQDRRPAVTAATAAAAADEDGLHNQVWRWMYQLTDEELDKLPDEVWDYHCVHDSGSISPNECSSILVQRVRAPLSVVWSVVRRFDKPQLYKNFIRSCSFKGDELRVGSTREVTVVSGLPATSSTERLEILDEENHVLSFRVLGGDHRLNNYRSLTSLHEFDVEGSKGTLVVESYVVDVPLGNTGRDTCLFTDTVVRCNLQSLAHMTEKLAAAQQQAR